MLKAFGSNGRGQLGLNHIDDVATAEPVDLPFPSDQIAAISSGGNHSLILTKSGEVFGSGLSDSLQLGAELKDQSPVLVFTKLEIGHPVKAVAGGWEFSVFVLCDDRILVWGQGFKGELGCGSKTQGCFEVTGLPTGKSVLQVKSAMNHVLVLFDDGSVWGWGAARKGQLSFSNPHSTTSAPSKFPATFSSPRLIYFDLASTATHICCGRDFSIIGCQSTGSIFLLGGSPVLQQQWQLRAQSFRDIQSGWSTVHILLENDQIVSIGNNSHGQFAPMEQPKISSFCSGSEHTLALDFSNNLYSWGWGEHGNCGPLLDSGETIYGARLLPEKCSKVFAGCATSFIIELQ